MEEVSIIGIDLAKRSFQVHGAKANGSVAYRRKLSRGKLLSFLAAQPPCTVAMEACAGAHYWGREIVALGHEVRLVPPIYVKPFVKRQKNDAADAEAITEAAQRPTMHFVAVKTEAQQAQGMLFRTRDSARRPSMRFGVTCEGRARIGQLPGCSRTGTGAGGGRRAGWLLLGRIDQRWTRPEAPGERAGGGRDGAADHPGDRTDHRAGTAGLRPPWRASGAGATSRPGSASCQCGHRMGQVSDGSSSREPNGPESPGGRERRWP